MDFNKTLFENTRERPLICAHRGLSGGNIPCNTIPAFNAALMYGADMVELDVTKSLDGEFYVFHPGMEPAHLCSHRYISAMKSQRVNGLRYTNQDNADTIYPVNTLEEVLIHLKNKCYINVDKFWKDIPGITSIIRRCGVEKQVIVKTDIKEKYLFDIEKYAPDLMFMPMVRDTDKITDRLLD